MKSRREEKIKDVAKNRQSGLVLVLEDIHDPHNAAAIERTADAFGIQHVYLIFEKEERYDPKKVGKESSSSANKWLDFHTFNSTAECLAQLTSDGYTIVGTALTESAEGIFEADLTDTKIALLIGNEHRGLSKTAMHMSDRVIKIPMRGMVQSLNVSVSAALCVYEITRQRMDTDANFTLPEDTHQKLSRSLKNRA